MPRYIDADKINYPVDKHKTGKSAWDCGVLYMKNTIDRLPTADVAEVKHGEWKPDYETFVDDFGMESDPIITAWICSLCAVSEPCKSHYCPNCGAKMDGDVK